MTGQEITFSVKGTHCAACELLIEKKLLNQKGITAVDASANPGNVVIS